MTDFTAAGMPGSEFLRAIGLHLTSISAERVEAVVEVGPAQHQPNGIVHGGVWCSVVESTASLGGAAALAPGRRLVGVHNSTQFLRPMTQGRASVVAEPLHQGRTSQLWEVRVSDEQGRAVAIGQVRLQHLEPRPDSPAAGAPTA